MNKKYEQLIADYLIGNLDAAGETKVEELLSSGEIDFADFREIEKLCDDLGMISVPQPSTELSQNFYRMLEDEKQAKEPNYQSIAEKLKTLTVQFSFPKFVYTIIVLIVGGVIGAQFNHSSKEMEQLSSEMQELREMMLVGLLQESSATDRLKAVNISTKLPSADFEAIQALLFTLNNDSSVNVRVQSIEALKRWGHNEQVREGLVKSIVKQESPVVIVELADAMIELELRNSAQEFEQLLKERELDYTVQQKLENSIAVLM